MRAVDFQRGRVTRALSKLDVGAEAVDTLTEAMATGDTELVLMGVQQALQFQRVSDLEKQLAAAERRAARKTGRDKLAKYRDMDGKAFRALPIREQVEVYRSGRAGRDLYHRAYRN